MTREEVLAGIATRKKTGSKIDCDSDVVITETKNSIGIIFNGKLRDQLMSIPGDLWIVLTDPDDTAGRIYFLLYGPDDLKTLVKPNGSKMGRWKLQRYGNQCSIYIGSKGNKASLNKKLRKKWSGKGYPIKTDFQSALQYIDDPDCSFCEL